MISKKIKTILCECQDCKKRISFELPDELVTACEHGKLVIFAGAGISTEGRDLFPFSLYDDVKEELGVTEDLTFPELMSLYVLKTKDNRSLLNKIKNRIDYSKSFPDLYSRTTNFHRELSTIHLIQEIVTTNWDDFFETNCAATPIVTDEDFTFWDQPFRKVFKIHGSINNPGSVVATKEDYSKCYKNLEKNAVGGSLRQLLATKTIVFVGYSFGDYDFNKIYQYIHKTMGNLLPHSYFVTLSGNPPLTFKQFSPTIIHTDATFFLTKLKEKLVEKRQMLPDSIYDNILEKLFEINKNHFSFIKGNIKKDPSIILCGSYQDGIIHALERALKNQNTGQYSHICRTVSAIDNYLKMRKAFLSKKRYFDVAYIDGYITGLFQIIPEFSKKTGFPMYYVFGSNNQLLTIRDYKKENKNAIKIHKSSYKWAQNLTKESADNMVAQHSNFLMGVSLEELKE